MFQQYLYSILVKSEYVCFIYVSQSHFGFSDAVSKAISPKKFMYMLAISASYNGLKLNWVASLDVSNMLTGGPTDERHSVELELSMYYVDVLCTNNSVQNRI